jgi:hypothetical protein
MINSTDYALLLHIKKMFNTYPMEEQRGLVIYNLITDALESQSFEYIQALHNNITSSDVSNFDGENVSVAMSCLQALL